MSRRLILALLALTGLLAMHGITASTASAALPCGQAPTTAHAHAVEHGAPHAATDPAPPSGDHGVHPGSLQVAGLAGGHGDAAHAGMLCLAVLTMVLLLGVGRGWPLAPRAAAVDRGLPLLREPGSRAPPDDRQSLLCTWRT